MNCNPEPLEAPKTSKIRSAWISFAGRIAAQLIGAAATVGLGVVVFGSRTPPVAAAVAPAPAQPSVLVAKAVRTQQGTVIVLVPLDRYNEVTSETVETVTRALATDLSHSVNAVDDQARTPVWAAANAH